MEVGIDVLDIERMEKLIDRETFLNKFFAQGEIDYLATCNDQRKATTMAGYYACKEAFLKAIGIGIGRGIDLKDICVTYNSFGRPNIVLTEEANKIFKKLGFKKACVSISDTASVSVAICIVE